MKKIKLDKVGLMEVFLYLKMIFLNTYQKKIVC